MSRPMCPLCNLRREEVLWSDGKIIIAGTKNLKGHRNRIMVLAVDHVGTIPGWLETHAVQQLERHGRAAFDFVPRFVILSPLLGSVPDHWHYVATDLEPKAEDFGQVMRTPWVKVVELI